MIWIYILGFFTIFFGVSSVMNALDDRPRGFVIHGVICFVFLIATIIAIFYHRFHP